MVSRPKKSASKTATPPPLGPAWTRAQRAALPGARNPHPLDPPPPCTQRSEAISRLCLLEREHNEWCGPVNIRNADAETLYAPIRASAVSGEISTPLQAETELVRYAMLRTLHAHASIPRVCEALAALWLDTMGLEFVLEMTITREHWRYSTSGLQRNLEAGIEPDETSGNPTCSRLDGHVHHAVRRLLFALPEASFVRHRDAAIAWLEAHPLADAHHQSLQVSLVAFLLARDPAFANQVARASLHPDQRYVDGYAWLLASIDDISLARALVKRYAVVLNIVGATLILPVIDTFGGDAMPWIVEVLKHTENRRPKLNGFYLTRWKQALKLANSDPRPRSP